MKTIKKIFNNRRKKILSSLIFPFIIYGQGFKESEDNNKMGQLLSISPLALWPKGVEVYEIFWLWLININPWGGWPN